jgi:hypothetical protein
MIPVLHLRHLIVLAVLLVVFPVAANGADWWWVVTPHRARAGSMVTVWGASRASEVLFNGVSSPELVAVPDTDRLRARVPPNLPPGPVTVVARYPTASYEIADDLTIDPAAPPERTKLAAGDYLLTTDLPGVVITCPCGSLITWWTADGQRAGRVIETFSSGPPRFDFDGFLITPSYAPQPRFDAELRPASKAPAYLSPTELALFNHQGDVFVYPWSIGHMQRFARDARLLADIPVSSPFADLAADQCTLIYTVYPAIRRFDVCRNEALPPFYEGAEPAGGPVRFAPDGKVYSTVGGQFTIFSSDGQTLERRPEVWSGRLMQFSSDGKELWTSSGYEGSVRRYDRATWNETRFNAENVIVYSAWTAAIGTPAYAAATPAEVPALSAPLLAFLGIALTAVAWRATQGHA